MRITINREPGRICNLCGKPLEIGEKGANYLPNSVVVRRGHPECVNAWRNRILAEARRRA